MQPVRPTAGFIGWSLLVLVLARPAAGTSADDLRYNRDIRPILAENCFQCHGPDKAQRKAKLRLDVRDEALAKQAFVPGRPAESELLRRLVSTDPETVMPPPASHKTVTAAQREILSHWIAAGAPYEAHWAYQHIVRPPLPPPPKGAAEVRHPIDRFIRERLAREGLEPAPAADRATLLRRLSLDLIGLPPTPAEVAAFAKDRSRHAYERQVERLLASPHHGERLAVPWLDAVRFTDTVGYHGDQNQRIFPYRDYVIGAFNANKPFDQFTVEQLAGDLLPQPTVEQRVATGCNRLNMMTREGGAQPKEYLAKYQGDRVRTVSTAWLGSTLACAECHDHKYDPFTMRDFYSLSAYFADIQQWGVYQDYGYTPNPDLRGWSNDHPFPPEIEVESPYLRMRLNRLGDALRDVVRGTRPSLRTNEVARKRAVAWRASVSGFLRGNPSGWQVLTPLPEGVAVGTNRSAATHTLSGDGSLRFAADTPTKDTLELPLPGQGIAALRLELLPDAQREGRVLRGSRGGTTLEVEARVRRAAGEEVPLRFSFADANRKEPRYENGQDLLGVQRGWRLPVAESRSPLDSVWLLRRPFAAIEGDVLVLTLKNDAAARIRVSISPLALDPEDGAPAAAYARLGGRLPKGDAFDALFLRGTAWETNAFSRFLQLEDERYACRNGRAWTLVTVATNALVTRVLPRGNWMDESGAVVVAAPPRFLTQTTGLGVTDVRSGAGWGDADPAREPSGGSRLDLARWLTSRDNPLTARNFVNRLWAQFFGSGISARLEDLGIQGEWPTHPELLDWLAAEFMEPMYLEATPPTAGPPHAWDVRHLVRLIVTSETYRQSCEPSAQARDLDPQNKLLARQSPRRLEAEFVRDNALFAAGLLNLDVGGPSVFPYQPAGYYANLQFPDRDYVASPDERQYRRGIYMHWQRTFLHPMLANFDAQSREECVAARLVSNTPQQALTLLNDPTFVEAGRVLAERALERSRDDGARCEFVFRRVLGRPPTGAERDSLLSFLREQRAHYVKESAEAQRFVAIGHAPTASFVPPTELAAWANVARVVLNLHEAITRY